MKTERDELDPIDPRTAQELYLDHKETHCAAATLQNHRYRTNHFVRWCGEAGIDNFNDLTGRSIHEYRLWRKNDGELSAVTVSGQMSTIRVFLKWAASIEAAPSNLGTGEVSFCTYYAISWCSMFSMVIPDTNSLQIIISNFLRSVDL